MFWADLETNELFIYDEIGPAYWGLVSADAIIDSLKQMTGKHVTARINTPGGSVDEGVAIYNALKEHKGGVTTIVDSLAASMGSYIMQAGERRVVAGNAAVMVHDPWTIAFGNSTELRKTADVLDKYRERLVPDYAARSGKTNEEITAILKEETWYTAQEAVDAGFADEVKQDAKEIKPKGAAALARICSKIPDRFAAKLRQPKMTIDELKAEIRRLSA